MTNDNSALLIQQSCKQLLAYIEKEQYRGYDPYDALLSPLFGLPVLNNNKLFRFGIQQLVKRSPINLRAILQIKKGINPVTLGLCIQGYTNLAQANLISKDEAIKKCNLLQNELIKFIPEGYKGACWGYDFPWQSRHMTIAAFQPTIVATGIITNALFLYHQFSGNTRSLDLCKSACEFILHDINQTIDPDGSVCFSYSPFDKIRVFNASMKGVRALSQVYSVTQKSELAETALKGVRFVMKQQKPNGSWNYAEGKNGEWVDNYHTGYVLDCLNDYMKNTGDYSWQNNQQKGFDYYSNTFFQEGEIPKFFNNATYPIDCTAGGQSLLTLCKFNNLNLATNVALYLIKSMQSPNGNFYFRKYRYFTEKQSFMRWSNAWMFAGLSDLLKSYENKL